MVMLIGVDLEKASTIYVCVGFVVEKNLFLDSYLGNDRAAINAWRMCFLFFLFNIIVFIYLFFIYVDLLRSRMWIRQRAKRTCSLN